MADNRSGPARVARLIAARRDRAALATGTPAAPLPEDGVTPAVHLSDWRRECFTLPTGEARETVRAWLARYPQARWQSEIENWRIVGDNLVQVTMRRLPEAE